jgi:GNAT superfamily N-acetyltransferase
MERFEIRRAGEEDRERIIALVSNMISDDMAARYQWLYASNPHGRALTWLAIERESGEAVACTSLFPRKVMVGGRERIGSMGGDCWVEPRVRRQGLATALHRQCLLEMSQFGVDFMYGPPVPNNLAALIRAGSRVVTSFKRWSRPLTGKAAYRAVFGDRQSKLGARLASPSISLLDRMTRADLCGLALEEISGFAPEFDLMFDRAAATHRVICRRDCQYLAWRYLNSPSRRQLPLAVKRSGELVGMIALEIKGEYAFLVDLLIANDAGLIDATLQLALDYAAAVGCSNLEISLTQGCPAASRLRRFGFIGRDEQSFQVLVFETDPQAQVLLSHTAWHFTMADKDMDTVFSRPLH